MNLRGKLLLAFSVGVVFLFIQSFVNIYFVNQLRSAALQLTLSAESRQSIDHASTAIQGLRSQLELLTESDVVSKEQGETVHVFYSDIVQQLEVLTSHSDSLGIAAENLTALMDKLKEVDAEYDKFRIAVEKGSEDSIEYTLYVDDQLLGLQEVLSVYNVDIRKRIEEAIIQEKNVRDKPVVYSLVIAAGAAVLLFLISWVLSSYAVSVIKLMGRRAKSIASGDLTGKPLEEKSQDELGELSSSMNHMTQRLRQLVSEINHTFSEVNEATSHLSSIAVDTNKQIHSEAENIGQALDSLLELENGSAKITEEAAEAKDRAEQAISDSKAGADAVRNSAGSVDSLCRAINEAAELLSNLSAGMQSVESILSVINGISEQTNLLALNAAIEAARAGEHGRGFAVVADEVRTLATRTLSSASEISQMIDDTRKDSEKVIRAIEEGASLAKAAMDSSQTAENSIDSIVATITRVNEANNLILSIVHEHEHNTHSVSEQLQKIKQAEGEKLGLTEKVNKEASLLSGLSDDMEKKLKQFAL